jgi:hypothetical protein
MDDLYFPFDCHYTWLATYSISPLSCTAEQKWPAPLPNIKKILPLGGLQSAQLLPKNFNVGTFSTIKKGAGNNILKQQQRS